MMGLTCKHWAAQKRSGFTRSICSDCPRRSEILTNRKATRTAMDKPTTKQPTPTLASKLSWNTGDAFASPKQLEERKARVEADLEALRAELAAQPTRTVRPQTAPTTQPTEPRPVRNPYRPAALEAMVGQKRVIQQLRVVLHGGRLRGDPLPNVLLTGPPGFGKSSLAAIIAEEIESTMVQTTGMMLKKPEDLVALLLQVTGPTVLFLDEVHRLPVRVQETLFSVMEDGTLDVVGAGESTRHDLPELLVVAATTASGLLAEPFRARFGAQFVMDDYSDDEIATIAANVWETKGMPFVPGEATELNPLSLAIPRRAITVA
jgi:MoxR-like ATPase